MRVIRTIRTAAALIILTVLGYLGFQLLPLYLQNRQLQRHVEELARSAGAATRPADALRLEVVQIARDLGLPVRAENVQVRRENGLVRIECRYAVRVDLPLYTTELHFYPGAGSR